MRKNTSTLAGLALGLLAGAAMPAYADDEGWFGRIFGSGGAEERHDRDARDEERRRRLTATEREIIREYYREHGYHRDAAPAGKRKQLPPGLQKKVERGGRLPPGWQKKVARGEVIPDDVYRYRQPLPDDLRSRLPRQPDGTELYRIDDDVVRVIVGTRILADILDM